jgi:small subunit ribosomal protein S21
LSTQDDNDWYHQDAIKDARRQAKLAIYKQNPRQGGNIALQTPHLCAILYSLREIRKGVISLVEVSVRDGNIDQALRALKKKMQREGIFREMKMRKHYEKPSERRVRESAESVRRARKLARKQADKFD